MAQHTLTQTPLRSKTSSSSSLTFLVYSSNRKMPDSFPLSQHSCFLSCYRILFSLSLWHSPSFFCLHQVSTSCHMVALVCKHEGETMRHLKGWGGWRDKVRNTWKEGRFGKSPNTQRGSDRQGENQRTFPPPSLTLCRPFSSASPAVLISCVCVCFLSIHYPDLFIIPSVLSDTMITRTFWMILPICIVYPNQSCSNSFPDLYLNVRMLALTRAPLLCLKSKIIVFLLSAGQKIRGTHIISRGLQEFKW